MTEIKEIYKCSICGNIVEVLHSGAGELVCCGKPMDRMEESVVDASLEKHVPIIEKTEKGAIIKVGSTEHPMTEEHNIEWIEATIGNKSFKKFLTPGEKPEMVVCTAVDSARAYCNLHGLWKSK